MNLRFAPFWMALAGCSAPQAAFRPDTADGGMPFAAEGDGAVVRRSVIEARIDADGAQVDGPWESLRVRTAAWGRAEPLPFDPAGPEIEADGSAVVRDAGMLERWTSVGEGALEQAWELYDRPHGDGPIRIEVHVEGAAIAGVGS